MTAAAAAAATMDKTEVQMLVAVVLQQQEQAEDDEIYRLFQICTAPFSNSRSILSHHPRKEQSNRPLIRYSTYYVLKKKGNKSLPLVQGIHRY